jgi:acetate kinase
MNILVINSGSSSVKYQVVDMSTEISLVNGAVERIGEVEGQLVHRWREPGGEWQKVRRSIGAADHREAFRLIGSAMQESGVLQTIGLQGIGHRVVHGGEEFRLPALIDPEVVAAIRAMSALAPLHNPPNLAGIEICLEQFPKLPQVAVFDTAFHQSMPAYAYRYALPEHWYSEHRVRRYGFHGTSHQYVAEQTAAYLGQPLDALNLITLHLGNGASAAAIRSGRCVDTSMGLTPLEGLMMGTRCGDIDPAILFYMAGQSGIDLGGLDVALNRESGLKGVCGVNDMRAARELAESGDTRAQLAIAMYCYRIRKYIGAYFAVLGRLDALVFTAGIGENSPGIREEVCSGLEALGIVLDSDRNRDAGDGIFEIQRSDALVRVLVVPTNEEIEIARETAGCITAQRLA